MRKAALPILLVLLMLAPGLARAESGMELVENSAGFDGMQVTYQGEVIGVLMRGDHAWVNVIDNGVAIGVWCSAEDAGKISFAGDYTHVGDYVSVTGTFHLACTEHGGDMDIHAENFTVLTGGRTVERMPNLIITLISAVLLAAAILTIYWFRRLQKERRGIVPWPMSWRS